MFACPCCGKPGRPTETLLKAKVRLEGLLGFGLRITSSCRCSKHNKQVGGSPKSQHLIGRDGFFHAFDVVPAEDGAYLDAIAMAAYYEVPEAMGVGYYPESHVHIDDRYLPAGVDKASWVALKKRKPTGEVYFVYLKWSF